MSAISRRLTHQKDVKNLYIFIIFTLSIFYTFSFSAFILYAVVIFLFFLTLKKDYIFLILTIIAIFFIVSSIKDRAVKCLRRAV